MPNPTDRQPPVVDLLDRLERERQAADRQYNDALTALDGAFEPRPQLPPPPPLDDRSQLEQLNRGWKILPDAPPISDRSLKGRLRGFVWRIWAPALDAQQRFNAALVEHINRNAAVHVQAAHAAEALVEAARREVDALVRFEWLLLQYFQTITAYVDTKDRREGGAELREQFALIQQRLLMLERRMTSAPTSTDAAPVRGAAPGSADLGSVAYLGFEDRFRGSPETIRARLEPYVPLFASAQDVVDLGCGRGELLELLRDHGVSARGIDANGAMVEECRGRGLAVEQADAVTFLEAQSDAALGGLVAIQVVEHLEPAYLVRMLALAHQKLRPGAPLVLETINPACWMAFFEAYIRDLTHVRPLHPDTLRYLVQASGFVSVNVEYRQAVTEADRLDRVVTPAHADAATAAIAAAVNSHADKLNARLFSAMDYAVVARR
jgi:2-polyprenyl-3-methyl-5-hydroxy-6-metoxy-1,4-benzoquinol methylase